MKNNSFLTSLSKDLVRDVRDLMAGNSSVEAPLEELGEAAKTLTAKQKKIDKNHNGKLDADDFRRLRAEGIDRVVIHSPYTPDIHGGLAEVTHRDLRTGVVTVMFENMYYKLKKGQFKELPEEFEQLDELSKATLGSYINKAQGKQVDAGYAFAKSYGKDNKKENDAIRSVGNKSIGISRAVKKLAKEETEELDELSTAAVTDYTNRAFDQSNSIIKSRNLDLPKSVKKSAEEARERRRKGIVSAGKRLGRDEMQKLSTASANRMREEVELTQEELDNIEAILADLDEERLDEIGTTWQPTSKRVKAAREAAYRKKIGEEEYAKRQKAKAEKKAAYSADLKKKREERYKQERLAKKQASANPEPEKPKNKSFFNTIKSKLGLGEEINHEDLIEALLADLDEGRGRPPKEGSEAWKRRQTQAADDIPALGIQLRKAASINKPVIFANGESKQIHPTHINRFNDHMDARKTSQEKADFQKTANKSHADFVKAVTADIPHRAKDTGEIVKYGK